MTIDGVLVEEGIDFTQLAEDALRGRLGSSRSTSDGRLSWLFGAWPQLRGSAFAHRIADAIGLQLRNGDRETKHGALLFFVTFPDAGQLEFAKLADAYTDRAVVRGVYPADGGSADLEWWLLRAIASVASTGASAAMRMIEDEALRPDGKVEPIMHTLITRDGVWFARHRGEVLRLHPEAKGLVETIEQGNP